MSESPKRAAVFRAGRGRDRRAEAAGRQSMDGQRGTTTPSITDPAPGNLPSKDLQYSYGHQMTGSDKREPPRRPDGFPDTMWSEVVAAGENSTPRSRQALERLCSSYWRPLYAYVRRDGHDREEAEDLTQAFFTRLLDKNYLSDYRRERGRFRSFLLACLKHFLANEREWASARKRGGGKPVLPLEFDVSDAESEILREPPDDRTPEVIYEHQWAMSVVARVQIRIEREFERAGKAKQFEYLRGFVSGDDSGLPYREIAAKLGATEGALKVAVHRLRRRFRELLRDEISQTVLAPEEIQEEIGFLMSVLGR
jgi:RNA polymerase sigma factor (sigma-70 family)